MQRITLGVYTQVKLYVAWIIEHLNLYAYILFELFVCVQWLFFRLT